MIQNAVSDSTCLIGLERINRLDILAKSFKEVYIPPMIEMETGLSLGWLVVKPVRNTTLVRALTTQVDAGESEVIALALELKEVIVVLDDKKARRMANEMGLQVIGTIGLLLNAKKRSLVGAVKPILEDLNGVGFHISQPLYRTALQLAKEI